MYKMQQINLYIEADRIMAVGRLTELLLLVVMSVKDIREHKVSVAMLGLSGTLAGILILLEVMMKGGLAWRAHVVGLIIGMLFLGMSWITREALGYGDSCLLCILGLYLGGWTMLGLLIMTWLYTAVLAGIALVRKRFRKKTVIPMIPCILAGYVTVCLEEVISFTKV